MCPAEDVQRTTPLNYESRKRWRGEKRLPFRGFILSVHSSLEHHAPGGVFGCFAPATKTFGKKVENIFAHELPQTELKKSVRKAGATHSCVQTNGWGGGSAQQNQEIPEFVLMLSSLHQCNGASWLRGIVESKKCARSSVRPTEAMLS